MNRDTGNAINWFLTLPSIIRNESEVVYRVKADTIASLLTSQKFFDVFSYDSCLVADRKRHLIVRSQSAVGSLDLIFVSSRICQTPETG